MAAWLQLEEDWGVMSRRKEKSAGAGQEQVWELEGGQGVCVMSEM